MKFIVRLGTALLVLFTFAAARTPAIATAQSQSVEQSISPAGITFTFHVSGFAGDERVGYWLNAPNGTILALDDRSTHATNGELTYSWLARPGVPLGGWEFVAEGVDSRAQSVVPFQITAEPGGASPGSVSADPSVGGAGTSFAFSAFGFASHERVGYWLNAPNGSIIPIDDFKHFADSDGEFNLNWLVPPDAAPGSWHLVAQGSHSGVLQDIAFEIR